MSKRLRYVHIIKTPLNRAKAEEAKRKASLRKEPKGLKVKESR